jgi:DNA-binding SARP family transcriptional activator
VIRCQTLGPPLVLLEDGTAPATLQWHKNLALLVYLARSPKRTRGREHLCGLLWGDQPEEDARHSLNQAVSTLRNYARESVESDRTSVRLTDRMVTLDVEQLDALAASGDDQAAAGLITGLFLEGFSIAGASEFDVWMSTERTHWQRRSIEILTGLAAKALGRGERLTACDAALRAQQLDNHSDVAMRAWMRAMALDGDGARALDAYAVFVERLQRELGAEPDAETKALADRIRRGRGWRLPKSVLAARGSESRRAPLVGRGAELEQLVATWTTCRQGRTGVAVVEGDGGTGKTRLAEELAARARLEGAVIAAVRAVEADQTDPWSGVLGIVRGGLLDAPGSAAASPEVIAELRRETPLRAPGRALSELLRVVADEQPVVLVVDDAYWLDRESLLALGGLVRDLGNAPVLLLVTTSPHLRRAELDELRSHLGRELRGTAVALGPLGEDAVRALARWAAPSYDEVQLERLTRRVIADSAGIPLLAVELLNAVAQGLDLKRVEGAWPEPLRTLHDTLPDGLPDAITAAVRVNFHRLSPDAQHVLIAAAVLNGRLPTTVLGRVSGMSGEALSSALDELEWQRWLVAEARGYAFVARIVRDVLDRDMVTAGQRRRILQAAGR